VRWKTFTGVSAPNFSEMDEKAEVKEARWVKSAGKEAAVPPSEVIWDSRSESLEGVRARRATA
jgi:hypothetical protein